ncbi:hypothetical protein IW140_005971 [Coemansia sp. RSA 1813]|nr:hypothetical protein EV178_005980 [Coemansia sp. RSA 1646]KAJ1767433.1 hypothetical protein LPJ74_005380 [Coemansia sp. RSA 1843]KAJ2086077.1 hypothetical protein IW138_005935 [Coemansia sp. RSA 986]KAJ2210860.1 hypothetical protein EV179_005945 [Coemansia sp. RSA 487]KAJ2563826.1 hypothetical protein IW140_005971 [Coemansia sp. RSA 1813]
MKIFAAVTAFAVVAVSGVAAYEARRPEYHAPVRVAPRPEYHGGAHAGLNREYRGGRAEYRAPVHAPVHHEPMYNGYRGNGRHY